MTTSKAKGTAAETAVVKALQRLGWPHTERRALSGNVDKGDITGIPGICIEVKDAKTWTLAAWMRETETERRNAGADYGILVIKAPRVGHDHAEGWLTVMDQAAAFAMVIGAQGFGEARSWGQLLPVAGFTQLTVGSIGLVKAYEQLKGAEGRFNSPPVTVNMKRRVTAPGHVPGYDNIMRLEDRCRLLIDAGYGTRVTMDAVTSDILKESVDDS